MGKPKPTTKPKAKVGGARAGAGRKHSKLPDDLVAKLGPPPTTAKELRVWASRIVAELLYLGMRGELDSGLASMLRAGVGALDRVLPPEPAPKASRYVDDDDEPADDREGPELDNLASVGIHVGK